MTDSNGRRFDNFSSLSFDWEVSNPAVAKMQQQGKLSTELSVTDNSRKIMTCKFREGKNALVLN